MQSAHFFFQDYICPVVLVFQETNWKQIFPLIQPGNITQYQYTKGKLGSFNVKKMSDIQGQLAHSPLLLPETGNLIP